MSKVAIFVAVLSAVVAAGCGGSASSTAPTPIVPRPTPAPVTTVIAEGGVSGLEPTWVAQVAFATVSSGNLQAIVDWTSPNCDVDVGLVRGKCTLDEMNGGTCPWLALSTSTTAKPERISVAAAPAAEYTLYVMNWGPETESVSFQVMLTTGATASAQAAAAASLSKASLRGLVVRP